METPAEIATELSEVARNLVLALVVPARGETRLELMGWKLITIGWGGRAEFTPLAYAVRAELRAPVQPLTRTERFTGSYADSFAA